MAALQLIVNKLPGPLNSVAAGLMGLVSPATAAVSAIMEVVSSQIKLSQESEEVYIKQEVNLARLGAVLEATGAKTWTTTSSLQNMADSIRHETGKSTDEIMRMQSVLLGFTGITGENFERLTRNMVNMADVMGGDLASSANTFGRALENPAESLNALTRQGFVFTEEQKRMVRQLDEAGRLEEAQVIYLEAMERAFGDSAKATREAAKGINDYKQALEDLKLARGEFEASGGMTWQRFWREFTQSGIEDQTRRYREETRRREDNKYYEDLSKRADEVTAKYLQDIKTAEELIAVFNSGEIKMDALLAALQTKTAQDWNVNKLNYGSMGDSPWYQLEKTIKDYSDNYERMQAEAAKIAAQLEKNKNDLSASITKIEDDYDDTDEGKASKVEKKIADLIKLKDKTWEVDTGVFQGLSDEHKRMIDVIIKGLEESGKKAKELKKPYEDWVKVLAQATGYLEEDIGGKWDEKLQKYVGGWGGLQTVEKYADEVQKIQDTLLSQDGDLIKALGLDKIDVLESSAGKVRSALELMLNSGKWDGTKESVKKLVDQLEQFGIKISEIKFQDVIEELDKEYDLGLQTVEERIKQKIVDYLISLGIINPTKDDVKEYREKKSRNYLQAVAEQLEDAGKSTYELAVKRLTVEKDITKEAAEQALAMQKQIDYITNGYDFMGDIMTSIDDALRSIRSGNGGYGQYVGGRMAQSGMEMIEGSDVGNFIEGFQQGGIWGAIIETLIGALVKVIGGMKEMEKALNPVTTLLKSLGDVINFLHETIMQIADGVIDALKPVFALIGAILQQIKPLLSGMLDSIFTSLKDISSGLMPLIAIINVITPAFEKVADVCNQLFEAYREMGNVTTFGLLGKMNDWADTIQLLDDEQQEEAERLRLLNEQYKNLYSALKEQEEYYLQQRRNLNAEWAIENYQTRTVNDMILSPHGAFSTSPEDYIIATKHPENLMGGGAAPVYVTVINQSNATVSTQESTAASGAREIQVLIEGVVQNALAKGNLDSALDAAAMRRSGRRITA